MRIKGLVQLFNHVRSQLQAGLKPDDVEPFRKQVKAIVRDVEEICRKHGVAPDQLPAPSRLAYVFLKELDLDNLTAIREGEPAGATPTFRVKNVVKNGDHFAERLWQQLDLLLASSGARTQLGREIGDHISALERICAMHDKTPSALEAASRQVYCWLKFLNSEDNLTLHLEALQRAKFALGEHQLSTERDKYGAGLRLIEKRSLGKLQSE